MQASQCHSSTHVQTQPLLTGTKSWLVLRLVFPLRLEGIFLPSMSFCHSQEDKKACKRGKSWAPASGRRGRSCEPQSRTRVAGSGPHLEAGWRGSWRRSCGQEAPPVLTPHGPSHPGPRRAWRAKWWPQRWQVPIPRTGKCDLFWKKVFVDGVKDFEVRR